MTNIRLKRSVKSYVLRIYKTPDSDKWNWRFVLSSLDSASNKNKGFQTIEELSQFLGAEIEIMEKCDE